MKFCIVMILSSLIVTAIVYCLSASTVTTAFENSRLTIKSTADFVLPLLILSSLAAIAACGIVTIIVTLFISHRIAGPLYRLEHDIDKISKGNLKVRINVRKKDEFRGLAELINRMVESIQSKIVGVNKEIDDISAVGFSENDKQKLENIKNLLKEFKC